MSGSDTSWSTQQLTEFLAAVSSFPNQEAAERGAVERVAEALEAEVAVLARDGETVASVGFPSGAAPKEAVHAVLAGSSHSLDIPGAGPSPAAAVWINQDPPCQLLVARSGEVGFSQEELDLLRGMGRVLLLTLELIEATAASRRDAVAAERAKASAIKGAILESALDCVITADHHGRILDFNPAAERTFGYRREDVVGKTLAETIVPPYLRDAHIAGFKRYLDTGEAKVLGKRVEFTGVRADGSEFPAELAITAIDNEGEPLFAAYLRDITARRVAEEEMETSMSLLHATLESTVDGILVVDREGRIVNFNRKFVDMWRIPDAVIAARDDEAALNCILDQLKDPEAFLARVKELYNSDEEGHDVLEFKDGRVFERYSQPQRVGEENVGRVWSFRDMTEHRRLESELRQAQKMEAVGQLAGGVAHDFNNLLAVILNYAKFLEEDIDPSEQPHADVVGIRAAAERGAQLVRRLLVFSRKEIVRPQILDLNQVVTEMEGLLAPTIGENIRLRLRQASELWPVKADRSQVEQILMNLAVNARDAMSEGGDLLIETENVEAAEIPGSLRPFLGSGMYVRLSVRDSGAGMTDDVKARLFEPFFTTKGPGRGTGLGLATVYGIVAQLGGHIEVESAPGEGAVFDVHLPVTEERVEPASTPPPQAPRAAAGETIVVVEDEADVREIVTRILKRGGYEILAASSAEKAIEVFENHDGRIDLLLTDVIMPGMSGKALVEDLESRGFRFRTLFMSGYAGDIIARHRILDEGEVLVEKPFSAEELLARVREILDSVQAGSA